MYPDNSSAHILGYVSQVSAKDLQTKKYLKDLHVPGMSIGKTCLLYTSPSPRDWLQSRMPSSA